MAYKVWTGGAPAVAQVTTITVGGTPATSDVVSVSIGGKTMEVTIGTSATATAVADEIAASFNASSTTSPAPAAGYSRSIGGQSIGEFQEITATAASGVVTLTGTPGIPFTLTVTDDGAGTYATSTTTSATGPNDLANAENYLGGALLTAGDTLVCDRGSYDIKWNLSYYRDLGTPVQFDLICTSDFRGTIGLEPVYLNDAETVTHPEYRDRYLEIYSTTSASFVRFVKGAQTAVGVGKRYIDAAGQSCAEFTVAEGALHNSNSSTLEVVGGEWTNMLLRCGDIRLEPEGVLASNYMTIQTKLALGGRGDNNNLLSVDIGADAVFSSCDYVWQRSGNTTCRAHLATTGGTNDFNITGGTWSWDLADAGTQSRDAIIEGGGTLEFTNRGNLANVHVGHNATLDASAASSITIGTLVYLYAGSTTYNNSGAIASASFFRAGCSASDLTYVGPHNTQNAQTLPGAVSV